MTASPSHRLPPWEQIARASQLSTIRGLSDLRQLRRAFRNDRTRYRLLERLRWPNGFACGRCDDRAEPRRPQPGMLTCARCGSFHEITAGSVLSSKVAPMGRWFDLFWLLAYKLSPDVPSVARHLAVSHPEATRVVRGLQQLLAQVERERLSGEVELDARVMALPGAHAIVLLAAERGSEGRGRIRARVVSSIRAEVVQGFIHDAIEIGSTLHTDCWSAYLQLGDMPYHHAPQQTPPVGGALTRIDRCATVLQRWLRKRLPAPGLGLNGSVAELVMRFNRAHRSTTGELFCALLTAALLEGRKSSSKRVSGVRRIALPPELARDRVEKAAG